MTASLEEALGLFNKWKSESTALMVTVEGSGFGFRFVGSISYVTPSGIVVSRQGDTVGSFTANASIGLKAVRHFEYLDIREAPEDVKHNWGRVLLGTLGVDLPASRWAFHELGPVSEV